MNLLCGYQLNFTWQELEAIGIYNALCKTGAKGTAQGGTTMIMMRKRFSYILFSCLLLVIPNLLVAPPVNAVGKLSHILLQTAILIHCRRRDLGNGN